MSNLRDVSDERLEMLVGIICTPGYIPTVAEPGCPRVKRLREAADAVWAEVVRRGDRDEPLPGERHPMEGGA